MLLKLTEPRKGNKLKKKWTSRDGQNRKKRDGRKKGLEEKLEPREKKEKKLRTQDGLSFFVF